MRGSVRWIAQKYWQGGQAAAWVLLHNHSCFENVTELNSSQQLIGYSTKKISALYSVMAVIWLINEHDQGVFVLFQILLFSANSSAQSHCDSSINFSVKLLLFTRENNYLISQ